MSASSVQLVRLISFKTAARRTSSGASFTSESSGASATRPSLLGGVLGGRRRASSAAQVRRQRVSGTAYFMQLNPSSAARCLVNVYLKF